MRFIEYGPSIPDDLLLARDEGRVVFFCGAGVSRAKAGLVDFFGLTESVLNQLRVGPEHVTRKVLFEAGEIHNRTGASGLISADRIFGLLERDEFFIEDIEAAVAKALKPDPNVDLSAHRIILELATTSENKLRLVTTNFDRLFEAASDGQIQIWQPSHIHNLTSSNDLNGIVHLHGMVDEHYQQAEKDGFILTSSQFGRAYLADGWATRFFRDILEQNVVVFIGYTADDPPVQYLLEALNQQQGQLTEVYAFQDGSENEAIGKWLHKGVQAIAFDKENDFCALWDTLAAWSGRARSPETWYDSVIQLAKQSPKMLRPIERGQVAHVVSSLIGAKRFSEVEHVPSAEWLCVFDPVRRYERPGTELSPEEMCADFFKNANEDPLQLDTFESEQNNTIIPFNLYGLDSDIPPDLNNEEIFNHNIPDTAWNAFLATKKDKQSYHSDFSPAFRGHWAVDPSPLCHRLNFLAIWLSKVANQPAAIWWAVQQVSLHKEIQQLINREMVYGSKQISPVIRQAWRYLFEYWNHKSDEYQERNGFHDLTMVISQDGWSHQVMREFITLQRPYIKITPNLWKKFRPPEHDENLDLSQLLKLEVVYPVPLDEFEVTDEWLYTYIKSIRKNLEYGLLLDQEIDSLDRFLIPSILSNRPNYDPNSLSSRVTFFSQLFQRLVKQDLSSAKQEFSTWPINDQSLFDRLRIFVAGITELISEQEFNDIFLGLTDVVFWGSDSRSDILLVISRRWSELSELSKKMLQERILAGRQRFDQESDDAYMQSNAWEILNRLHWLANQSCHFTFDLESLTQCLQKQAPFWKREHVINSVDPTGGVTGGYVSSNEDYSELVNENLANILSKSLEISARRESFLVENDPFAGLCREKSIKAFLVLTHHAKQNEFPEGTWQSFLTSSQREQDPIKFSALIAERLASYPADKLSIFISSVCNWLKKIGKALVTKFYTSYQKIVDKLLVTLEEQPICGSTSGIRNNSTVDWVFEAINSPVGDLVEILLFDPNINDLPQGARIPSQWLSQVNRLLSLPVELRRYVYVQLATRLEWFYYWDTNWTDNNLLPILESTDNTDLQAFWSGFFRSRIPNQTLYLRLKPYLLNFATHGNSPRNKREQNLIAFLLVGWGSVHEQTRKRLISNEEFHALILRWDDDARIQIFFFIRQWSRGNADWNNQLPQLLKDVWPKQKSARTPRVSSTLFDLCFSSIEKFANLADLILPLLAPIKQPLLRISGIDNILEAYPEKSLAIFDKVFSENTRSNLPFGLEQALDKIGKVDKKLRSDSRWLKLKRKFDDG